MDINKMLKLAGLPPKSQKLDENCAGGFAGTFEANNEDEARRKESRDRINKGNQDIDYDQAMTSESGCQSPYDDSHGQYGEKCLVGDDVVIDPSPEDNENTVTIDLGEDDDFDLEEPEDLDPDKEVHLDYEYGGEEDSQADSAIASINNVDDRYMDHTVDPDMMIQKIDAMQQGGMSSARAHYELDDLYNLPSERVASIYKRVMGEEVDEDYAADMDAAYPSNMKGMADRDENAIVISGDEEEDYQTSGDLTSENALALGALAKTVGSAVDAMTGEGIEDDLADTDTISSDEWADDERSELDMVDVGDPEIDMDMDVGFDDPTDEIPQSRTRDAMQDTESMIRAIMMAKENGAYTPHSEETLGMLKPDALKRILTKVGGGKVEEEDNDWRSEPGYQTKPSDTDGHLRGTSPYNGGEGFPTGSADNAVKHIGNTGGDFKDNPIKNADPVVQESDYEDCSYEKGINESLEELNIRLTEGFDVFCENYETALEAELNEIGSMGFSSTPSMRSRGMGLGRHKFNDKAKKAARDKEMADRVSGLEKDAAASKGRKKEVHEDDIDSWLEKEHGEIPAFLKKQAGGTDTDRKNGKDWQEGDDLPSLLQPQAESVEEEGEVDPTVQQYLDALSGSDAGLEAPEINHALNKPDTDDIPTLPTSIDSIDSIDSDCGMDDSISSLGTNAEISDILHVLRNIESKIDKG